MKNKGKLIIINAAVLLAIVILFPVVTTAFSSEEQGNLSSFLLGKAMSFEIPALDSFEKDEDDVTSSNISIKEGIISYLGLDFANPLNILKKELVFIDTNSASISSNYPLNPYKVTQDDLFKENTEKENPGIVKPLDNSKPEVLIYHTHTTECYQDVIPVNVSTVKNFNSFDVKRGVAAAGEIIGENLEDKYGIAVIHDKTIHNAGVHAESYLRSKETVKKYLNQYKNFKLIIDIHRDSNTSRSAMTKTINGKTYATFMFVVDKSNPHYSKNIAVVNKLISISNKLYPGLCRPTYPYNRGRSHFNQELTDNSVLIEIGSHISTEKEADNTAELIARIIAEYINGTKSTS